MWDIEVAWVEEWLYDLAPDDYDLVIAALEVLRREGPSLGRPLVDSVRGSRHKNMKELRPASRGRSEVRVLFAFDPTRKAILLVAGDKSRAWQEWYSRNTPLADLRFDTHMATLGAGRAGASDPSTGSASTRKRKRRT